MVHSKCPDFVIATETEIAVEEDPPVIQGYVSLVPKMLKSKRIRSVMYVREGLKTRQIQLPNTDLQIVVAAIGDSVIIGLYRQLSLITASETIRGSKFELEQFNEIESVIRSVCNEFKSVHLCGDMNIDPTRTEEADYYKKTLLNKWCSVTEELGLAWTETGPTFRSHGRFDGEHRVSTIDLVYSRSVMETMVSVLPDSGSDHSPLFAVIEGTKKSSNPKRETRQDRNWKNLDSAALQLHLLGWDWRPLFCSKDVNEGVSLLKSAMTSGIDVAVPLRVYCTPNIGLRLRPDTLKAMKERDKAKRAGALHYKALRNKSLSLIRRDYVSNNLERIRKGGTETAWKICAEIRGKSKSHSLSLPRECRTELEAAEKCNDYFIKKVLTLREDIKTHTTPKGRSYEGPTFSFTSVGVAAVRRALKKVKPKVSYGIDEVPIMAYKKAQEAVLLPLVHVINMILKEGVWPDEWKRAIIRPTLKSGKPAGELPSYRPVANLCSVSKIVEHVIHEQVTNFLEENGLLSQQQHGFRAGRSCETAITALMSRVGHAQDTGQKVGLVAWDYSAAFDLISKDVLKAKLYWTSDSAKKLLLSYVSDRVQSVRWNSVMSKVLAVDFGVPQGSVLAPLLFNIVTSDLSARILGGNPSAPVGVSQYADDTCAYAAAKSWSETEAAIGELSGNLECYSHETGLHLNLGKTQKLMLGHPETLTNDTMTILGITIDKSGGFNNHNAKVLSDLRKRLGMIRQLSVQLPRGRLLREIGHSLIVGRLQSSAFVTHAARLSSADSNSEQPQNKDPAQIVLNNLARVLLGVKRADHYRATDLVDRARISTVNQIVVRQSAIMAWRANNGNALEDVLEPYDGRSRPWHQGSEDMKKAVSQRCLPAVNMCRIWNSSEALRKATSLNEAKSIARRLAMEARHA